MKPSTVTDLQIRPARPEDREGMLTLWERSVRATHHFLAASDVVALRPLVAEELAGDTVDWWVLARSGGAPSGFMGLGQDSVEALFIDPDHQRQGGGRRLMAHAQRLLGGSLAVDVNEQNEAALGFYQSLGFAVIGRSPLDAGGRPYPILHLQRPAPAPPR